MKTQPLLRVERDYRPALSRIERETAARLRDHSTAQNFSLRGALPPTYEALALFEPAQPPETGPAPLPGQLGLLRVETVPHTVPHVLTIVERPARPEPDRRPPERGALCSVPGAYLGPCRFVRVHVGRSGAVSWILLDARCHQYHAYRPAQVRIARPKPREETDDA